MSAADRSNESSGINMRRSLKPVALSVLSGVVVCVIILLLFSALISTQNIPHSMINPLATLAISIGAFVAGWLCVRVMREKGLIYGAICGVVMILILLIASAIAGSGLGMPFLFKAVFALLCSMLGGVASVNKKQKKRR